MKTGTPNFFPIFNFPLFLEYSKQLSDMGMEYVDGTQVISVSDKGHAGAYRMEVGSIMSQDGFYVFLDRQPVLNSLEGKTGPTSIEELMAKLVGMKKLNQNLQPWEQVTKVLAEVKSDGGTVRLHDSGVISVAAERIGHLSDDMNAEGKTDQLEKMMKAILAEASGRLSFDVKFYKL